MSTKLVTQAFKLPFNALAHGGAVLIKGRLLNQHTGSRFAKLKECKDWLNTRHTGLLMDGISLRLSERESFQNNLLIARVGAGKTTRNIIPNVLARLGTDSSLVINDPKGEVFDITSESLRRDGFNVILINPERPDISAQFNPLLEIGNEIELEQNAEIIVKTGNPNEKDSFWNAGATRFVSLFLKTLRNAAVAEGRPIFTLSNLATLFQNFGSDGSALEDFMMRNTVNSSDPADARLWNEWKGLLTGNEEGVNSFVLNAITALRALSNPNLEWLTATSDFRLTDLRKQKMAIFFVTPPQHQEYYAFLTSLFFRSAFNAAMRQLPRKDDLPIYVLFDEFAHCTIPGFVSTANTIRGYRVSLTIVLQSIAQLSARYGKDTAQAILGGFNNAMTLSGSDPETARFFQDISGKVRERQRRDFSTNPQDNYREFNLLNADEIRTIASEEALLVSANRMPVRFKTVPYFENPQFQKLAALGACQLARKHIDVSRLPVVRI